MSWRGGYFLGIKPSPSEHPLTGYLNNISVPVEEHRITAVLASHCIASYH